MQYLIIEGIILGIIFGILYYKFVVKAVQRNDEIEFKNNNLEKKNQQLLNEQSTIEKEIQDLYNKAQKEDTSYRVLLTQTQDLRKQIQEQKTFLLQNQETLTSQEQLSNKAFENYCNILENNYREKEEEYSILCKNMENAYADKQQQLMQEADQIRIELDEMKKSRAAAMEALQMERQVKDNLSSYCIPISEIDKSDICRLESVAITLSKPRILNMLVWQTYFQKPLKTMAASILGADKVCGIYKITNIETDECYIGQAVDVAGRWSEHCKCGLGIDTPAANKLYKAMKEYNLWNFSFQLLEKCEPAKLNEREKYYIDFYNSYNFGYNSNKGIDK